MIRTSRLLIVCSAIVFFLLTTTIMKSSVRQFTDPSVVWQHEKQHDMANVQFSVGAPNRLQLANMRINGLDYTKVAMMMEMRSDPQIVPHLLHMMSVLDDDWPFRIYHSNENADLFEARLFQRHIQSGKLTLIPLNIDLSSHRSVSIFLTHRPLWENLAPAKHVLIFQPDSIICSRSSARVEDFFEWDYIGAPVHERLHAELSDLFMNGGFSLRNREIMLKVIAENSDFEDESHSDTWYEDQFFVKYMPLAGGNLPPPEVAMKFSVESIYYPTPLAVHQAERYLDGEGDKENIRALKNDWCPEMHLLYGRVGPAAFVCDANSEHYNREACLEAGGTPPEEEPAQEEDKPAEQEAEAEDAPLAANSRVAFSPSSDDIHSSESSSIAADVAAGASKTSPGHELTAEEKKLIKTATELMANMTTSNNSFRSKSSS